MSFIIEDIELKNFRSYKSAKINFAEGLTILFGKNGAGKTNVIEAVQLLIEGQSFRNPDWNDTIHWGEDEAKLSLHAKQGERLLDIVLNIKDGRRQYFLNGKRSSGNRIENLDASCVIFTPDDLEIVKSSAELRRREVDRIGSNLSSKYEFLITQYRRILSQRNRYLKQEMIDPLVLDVFSDQLSQLGSALYKQRLNLLAKLAPFMIEAHKTIDRESRIELSYKAKHLDDAVVELKEDIFSSPNFDQEKLNAEFREAFDRRRVDELNRRVSLVGPHRDDIVFLLNGRDARVYASQGQQRSIVLALKIAEVKLKREHFKAEPLLLLDDVLSELDESRRRALFTIINEVEQALVSTAHIDYFSDEILKKAKLIKVEDL